MRALRWFLLSPFLLGTPAALHAATFQVPADFATIQAAVNSATHGDEIIVATGTYNEPVRMNGKNLHIRSTDPRDWEVVLQTIVVEEPQSVFFFNGTETEECVIEGFTVTGSPSAGFSGRGCRAKLQYNFVTNNQPAFDLCYGLIQNNIVTGNSEAAGAAFRRCNGIIQNNLITHNRAYGFGGGIWSCDGIIQNNTFYGNTAKGDDLFPSPDGTGASISECDALIRNNILWGGPERQDEIQIADSSNPIYCCIEGWDQGGVGNLFVDPFFVDPENGDFRLRADSFLIDSGSGIATLTVDLEGNPRPIVQPVGPRGDGSGYDIGAYEFAGTVFPNNPPARPTNLSPVDGATDVSLAPKLAISPFSDPDPDDVHSSTQWQIDDNLAFANPEFDSGEGPGALLSIRASGGTLTHSATYYWRARVRDQRNAWSEWSEPTEFEIQDFGGILVPVDYPTVQAAIDAATDGNTIVVRGGRYFENIHFHGKDISLLSIDPLDPEVVADTILDGSRSGSVVTFGGTETLACTLAGFTVTNGLARLGGGISGNRAKAVIQYNAILENNAEGNFHQGGGLWNCEGVIQYNRIERNRAPNGRGGGLAGCDSIAIQYNTIRRNEAENGGGISHSSGNIRCNQIFENWALESGDGLGGGFYDCDQGRIYNNVIAFNRALLGRGFYGCTASINHNTIRDDLVNCTGRIQNNIIASSLTNCSAPLYCMVSVGWNGEGEGSFEASPKWVDFLNEDFRLLPDSPGIDAGGAHPFDPGVDFDGNPRPYDALAEPRGDGSDYDMGAFEFIGTAIPDPVPERPTNVFPADGELVRRVHFDLVSSEFMDASEDDAHVASHWQINYTDDFSEPFLDSGYTKEDKTSIPTFDDYNILPPDTELWWRVRHIDRHGNWSEWSIATSFTTRASGEVTVPGDFTTIQDAIDDAIDGDTIIVSPGTYVTPSQTTVNFRMKDITVRSIDPTDPSIVAATILRGGNSVLATVNFPETPTSDHSLGLLSGFTILASSAGITCNYSEAKLENCVIRGGPIDRPSGMIRNNRIESGEGILRPDDTLIEGNTILSGGIQGQFSFPIIRNNLITGTAGRAITECHGLIEGNTITHNAEGGIRDCNGTIRGNYIAFNTTSFHSPGIGSCNGRIEANTIAYNSVIDNNGGGITDCDGEIINNLVFSNSARGGAGILICDGMISNNTIINNHAMTSGGGIRNCQGTLVNNIVWGNVAGESPQIHNSAIPSHSCIQDWDGSGMGNFSLDPQFIDAENGDFRLLPTSPCIDAGAWAEGVLIDYWGDPRGLDGVSDFRGDGSNFDIGADEFLGKELFDLATDTDSNGWVDILDLLAFRADWHQGPPAPARSDFNRDDLIDPTDLAILLRDWKRGTDAR